MIMKFRRSLSRTRTRITRDDMKETIDREGVRDSLSPSSFSVSLSLCISLVYSAIIRSITTDGASRMRSLAFGRLHIRINSYVVIHGKSDTNPSRMEKVILSLDSDFLFFSLSLSLSLNICERARVSIHETERGTSAREGKRRVPFVRTRACVRSCVRTCVSARLAVTYMRARAYDLFLAGVSQPPDALFGTTRCHAPVPPLPSLALMSLRLALLVSLSLSFSFSLSHACAHLLPSAVYLSTLYFSLSLLLFDALFILPFDYPSRSVLYNHIKKLDTRFSILKIKQKYVIALLLDLHKPG